MYSTNRRNFLNSASIVASAVLLPGFLNAGLIETPKGQNLPNIILCMADDQGWGDVAYNGNKDIKTPVLDEMAASAFRFDRFYAAAPVCSPTRGSVMTGRHPNRYGCFQPNFSIRPEEITLAEVLKPAGYVTGHFGKWHLGPVKAGTPVNPGNSGFDEWLSHDNFFEIDPPLMRNGGPSRIYPGESSEVVVDAALEFIQKVIKNKKPFFTVVWFGSPHIPHHALAKDKELYRALSPELQEYMGEITAMDRAIGKMRSSLRRMGIADTTLLWYCSDNGAFAPGSTGGLRGKKGTLWEGGVRVPGIIEWPGMIPKPAHTDIPCSTMDIYPTIIDLLGLKVPGQVRPIDGISLKGLLEGTMNERPKRIPFWYYLPRIEVKNEPYLDSDALKGEWRTFSNYKHPYARTDNFIGPSALLGNRYKLHQIEGKYELYGIVNDQYETRDLAKEKPEIVDEMKAELREWQISVEKSLSGCDY